VDLVGNGPDNRLEEARRHELRRVAVDPGEDQLGGPVDGNEQIGLAALIAQLGDVDVEVTDLMGLEPLRFLAIRLGQARDAVTLQAAMQ
jgi:hypothetical protein